MGFNSGFKGLIGPTVCSQHTRPQFMLLDLQVLIFWNLETKPAYFLIGFCGFSKERNACFSLYYAMKVYGGAEV